jgi:hypothetical protein
MQASLFIILKTVVKSLAKFKKLFTSFLSKPLRCAGVSCFLILSLIQACSTFKIPGTKKENQIYKGSYTGMSDSDYADHLASLKQAFISTPSVRVLNNQSAIKYLESVGGEIVSKNEIFFKNIKKISVTILVHDSPLHFSLPKGEMFLSTGLISKYIKHESMLVSIISYELVRSEKLLYAKQVYIPVGYLSLPRMLTLGRLSLEDKIEIHKWAHSLTIRTGYDGEYYLAWLQIQNRNTADFLLQVDDIDLINREEALFKAFLIKNTSEQDISRKKNSSKNFYSFINSIRDQKL